jgi:hypothetical protein
MIFNADDFEAVVMLGRGNILRTVGEVAVGTLD